MMTFNIKLNYEFKNSQLLQQALTHKSFHNENLAESLGHNERLEFLGDAVLDLSLSTLLMEKLPDVAEGDLSRIRASWVNESFLSDIAIDLNLNSCMRMGRGESQTGGDKKPRLLASVFEALIGAIYLDSNFEISHKIITEIFDDKLNNLDLANQFSSDYKTKLQERSQEVFHVIPQYKTIKEEGPDHEKTFHVDVFIEDQKVATGIGKSKKQAEQNAAQQALEWEKIK